MFSAFKSVDFYSRQTKLHKMSYRHYSGSSWVLLLTLFAFGGGGGGHVKADSRLLKAGYGGFRQIFTKTDPLLADGYRKKTETKPLFLTPLIKAGKIKEAQKAAKVQLDGSQLESYSGYLTVNDPSCNSNMFFWFFPAAVPVIQHTNKVVTPTLLWLQGGPGGTSLYGLFNEHGPYVVTRNLSVISRKIAWTQNHNVLYIDNPVGTGYSFTKSETCYAKDETDVANDLYDALQQFFTLFPYFNGSDFYVTGESYAGKYVPAISYKIHQERKKSNDGPKFSFKGMAIGDGLCDPETMADYGDYLYNIGLIDGEDRKYFQKMADLQVNYIKQKKWLQAFQVFDDLLNGDLSGHPSYFANVTGYHYYFNYLFTENPAGTKFFIEYVQQPHVRDAIHVGNMKWNDGKLVEQHLINDIMQSVKPWIEELVEHYKVMFYNGQLDVIIPWPATDNFLTSMKWSGAKNYTTNSRMQWYVDKELAGYAKHVGENFVQVLVRKAGHMVPMDQPKWALDMISRFTTNKKFN